MPLRPESKSVYEFSRSGMFRMREIFNLLMWEIERPTRRIFKSREEWCSLLVEPSGRDISLEEIKRSHKLREWKLIYLWQLFYINLRPLMTSFFNNTSVDIFALVSVGVPPPLKKKNTSWVGGASTPPEKKNTSSWMRELIHDSQLVTAWTNIHRVIDERIPSVMPPTIKILTLLPCIVT